MANELRRFEEKLTPVPEAGCWLWTGLLNEHGYGLMYGFSRHWLAHRLSWRLRHGVDPPRGTLVLHKCDTPSCVNPSHLFLGDQTANMADMKAKGRGRRGARHGMAKLTDEQVAAIRADPRPQRTIANSYGISQQQVSRIVTKQAWSTT